MNMAVSLSATVCKQVQPLVSFQESFNLKQYFRRKEKVVIVMGATGTSKTRLAIDLASRFPAEIINSDKIQLFKGLDIVTNKVSDEECRGIPHHLLGVVDPNSTFSAAEFSDHAAAAVDSILARRRLPIIAGGSNSYIEALVSRQPEFRFRYDCCFLWLDVSLPVLQSFVSERVDRMVNAGFVEEVRKMFDPEADYSRGIRRAIGVPELHEYLAAERAGAGDVELAGLLEIAILKIKDNTCTLALRQQQKIRHLRRSWNLRRIDATGAFLGTGTWEKLVAEPSSAIVGQFLYEDNQVAGLVSPEQIPLAAATR